MPPKPQQENFEKDVVYLFQFPRSPCIPNLSPYCLKLETWLRMMDIDYRNPNCTINTRSAKGQVPFVELNGQQIADSYFILNHLSGHFGKSLDEHLTPEEQAIARSFDKMIEGSLFWVGHELMIPNLSRMFDDDMMGKSLPGYAKPMRSVIAWRMSSKFKTAHTAQGIGRHSRDEVIEIGQGDLKALSVFLGDKQFLMGDNPTRLDATAFGHIAVFHYPPVDNGLKEFIANECPNLVEYLERIKSIYWLDWDECCSTLAIDTKWKPEDREKAEKEKKEQEEKEEAEKKEKEEKKEEVAEETKVEENEVQKEDFVEKEDQAEKEEGEKKEDQEEKKDD